MGIKKLLDHFLKRKYELVSKKNNNYIKTGQIILSVYRTNDDTPRNRQLRPTKISASCVGFFLVRDWLTLLFPDCTTVRSRTREAVKRKLCVSYTPTRSIPPENITPAIGSRLEKKSILSEQKRQSRVYGSDPFHCMSSLPTERLAKTNSLLGRWQACEINL